MQRGPLAQDKPAFHAHIARFRADRGCWMGKDAAPAPEAAGASIYPSGAAKKTRTSTGFRPQRPQRCASTNSATTAKSLAARLRCQGGRSPPLAKALAACKRRSDSYAEGSIAVSHSITVAMRIVGRWNTFISSCTTSSGMTWVERYSTVPLNVASSSNHSSVTTS